MEFEGPKVAHQKTFVHVGLNVIKGNEPDRLQTSSNIGKPIYSCYNLLQWNILWQKAITMLGLTCKEMYMYHFKKLLPNY